MNKWGLLALTMLSASAGAKDLPLPEAPVRVIIPDVGTFDAALSGAYRQALLGQPSEDDSLARAWRQSAVGAKLEAEWGKLATDLPWTWESLLKLRARSVGIALLNVGHLEAVMIVDSPAAIPPLALPGGLLKNHEGLAYHLVRGGAADEAEHGRRMGLAWGQHQGLLFLATSERALKLALSESLAGRSLSAPMPGLISLDLDLSKLRADRYFRREFPFGDGGEEGHVRAALRLDHGGLVEVREGRGGLLRPGVLFEVPSAVAAGWEEAGFWPALRSAFLEPLPNPLERPVTALKALPPARKSAEDPYLVSLERPYVPSSGPQGEEGELAGWRALLAKQPVSGWGYALTREGRRLMVFPWPAKLQEELEGLCRATIERRSGPTTVTSVGDSREIRVGPGLASLALRRSGEFVWMSTRAEDLAQALSPRTGEDVVRWASLDLEAVRAESPRWVKAEGPGSPERIRPFSDRILGLLGWMPATRRLSLERRRTPEGWTERVFFEARP